MGLSTALTTRSQDHAEFEWAKQHARDVGDERASRSPWPGILRDYGSLDAWRAACAERRAADTERPLIHAIDRLLADSHCKPRGTLRPPHREVLLVDKPLAAYWLSVAGAGDEGWDEERTRIMRSDIRSLLPVWRRWGQVLLDANLCGDLEDAFKAPHI